MLVSSDRRAKQFAYVTSDIRLFPMNRYQTVFIQITALYSQNRWC